MKKNTIAIGSTIGGVINGIINGIINWFTVDHSNQLLITKDSITSDQYTVLGGAVGLAVSMSLILTTITFLKTKIENKPSYFPTVFLLTIKHAIYAFGWIVILGVLWQNIMGTIVVNHLEGALITGFIAFVLTFIIDFETKKILYRL